MLVDRHDLFIDLFIMLVRNIAYNFFEQIFERNDAFESAVFIYDETEVCLGLLHLSQDIFEPRRVNHVKGRLQHILEAKLLGMQKIGHHVFAVYEADHVIERLAINRQARVAILMESRVICSSELSLEIAAISVRGTIASRTNVSENSNTR